jgi:NTP pyrophosphatase (non-canonical NTP hydrolase)
MTKFEKLQRICHEIAREKGFWDGLELHEYGDRNNAEMLMLMVSELGEACEALRKEDWKNVGEELADCVIRIMDFCEGREINLEKEITKKILKNKKRPYKHGKKF